MKKLTTIAVSTEVYDVLRKKGNTGDTFDRVLRRILGLPASVRAGVKT